MPQIDTSAETDGEMVGFSSFNTTGWAAGESVEVTLCAGLNPETTHTVSIFKSTEPAFNGREVIANYVTLLSIHGPSDSTFTLLPPSTATPARKLEFLGDSITAGK